MAHKHNWIFMGKNGPPNLKGINTGNPWYKCNCGAWQTRPVKKGQ